MNANWGWIDFSTEDRDRISSIMTLLKDQGVLDELGISVIRDAISNKLFPGLSTIQTRAKYFLFTPVIVRRYYNELPGISLPEYFVKKEIDFIKQAVKTYRNKNELGIFGINLEDPANLQRKPSSVYWNGQRTLGIIKLRQNNISLPQYLRMNNMNLDRSISIEDDSIDSIIENNSGVYLPKNIMTEFNPAEIELTKEEAVYLRSTFTETLKINEPDSLLYALLTDKKLLQIIEQSETFYDFYNEFCLIARYKKSTLKQYMDLAYHFSEIMYGAHLLYNVLLQEKANNPENPYRAEWKDWKDAVNNDLDKLDLDLLKELVGNDPHRSINFLEKWIMNIKNDKQTALENLVSMQEFSCKTERARLKKSKLSPEEVANWIGMERMNYRLYQAQVVCSDIYIGGGYA